MEFSEIFGFLKIISKSIKLILKNGKSMASITAVSLLLSSFLFLLFVFVCQYLTTNVSLIDFTALQTILFFALVITVESCFFLAYFAITHISGIATILTAAASHSDTKLSLRDLYSMVRTKWRSPFARYNAIRRSPPKTTLLFGIVAVAVAAAMTVSVLLLINHPNPITITITSVAGVSLLVFQLYESVVKALASVIFVVEDECCEAAEATARAVKLVRGQRIHGFMVNLLLSVIGLLVLLGLWMIVGDKGGLRLVVIGLISVNTISLWRISVSLMYTVYYFQCKEYHAHNNIFDYAALPLNDIIP